MVKVLIEELKKCFLKFMRYFAFKRLNLAYFDSKE